MPEAAPINLEACEMDVRTGENYRLVFSAGDQKAEFFVKSLEAIPLSRLVNQ